MSSIYAPIASKNYIHLLEDQNLLRQIFYNNGLTMPLIQEEENDLEEPIERAKDKICSFCFKHIPIPIRNVERDFYCSVKCKKMSRY